MRLREVKQEGWNHPASWGWGGRGGQEEAGPRPRALVEATLRWTPLLLSLLSGCLPARRVPFLHPCSSPQPCLSPAGLQGDTPGESQAPGNKMLLWVPGLAASHGMEPWGLGLGERMLFDVALTPCLGARRLVQRQTRLFLPQQRGRCSLAAQPEMPTTVLNCS